MRKRSNWLKRLLGTLIAVAVLSAVIMAMRPQPITVELASVKRGRMEVAIRDDGRTRVRERYVISSPIAGQLQRVNLEVGDEVRQGETVVARILPVVPAFLNPREQARVEAAIKAAERRLSRAQTDVRVAVDGLEQARIDHERYKHLRKSDAATDAQLEQAHLTFLKQTELVNSARFQEDVVKFELEQEKAALIHMTREKSDEEADSAFEIRSPVNGRVLKLVQESAAVLIPGMPIIEVGNPFELEVIADILSNDAVKMRPGQSTRFVHWGGPKDLPGVVRLIEPSGFTKISALGVEEQRVNVIFDLLGSPSEYSALGDGYRVEVEVIVWESEDELIVPTSALFRSGKDWATFIVSNGKAVLRPIQIGKDNGITAQVLDGLKEGDIVISHPGDDVQDGVAVRAAAI
ncbi:efflux RND transporter periplasmic adaptor subunit [Planctomicrobium sp. SH527]|uniref:efflux RND transporter periplasmic adaptor subunit n=1 Tax=Planctomicrobium sp. SH527 TaxID=3448123 RepID=UPI003F5B8DB7